MRRTVWAGIVLSMSVAACGKLGTELLPAESTSAASGSSSSGSASSGSDAGGSGGASGVGGGGDAGGSGSGGGGGSACVPVPDPCPGMECGQVFDGCQMVTCGNCAPGVPCNMGLCCTPKAPDCTGVCGPQSDGCGGMAQCDDICGDGQHMTCQAGKCACIPGMADPNYDFAVNLCMNKFGGGEPAFCGEAPNPDAPTGCMSADFNFFQNGPLWCCQ